jgi:hypothetical protein
MDMRINDCLGTLTTSLLKLQQQVQRRRYNSTIIFLVKSAYKDPYCISLSSICLSLYLSVLSSIYCFMHCDIYTLFCLIVQRSRGQVQRVQRGILRHFMLVLDWSHSMADKEFKPNYMELTFSYLKQFFIEFFDQVGAYSSQTFYRAYLVHYVLISVRFKYEISNLSFVKKNNFKDLRIIFGFDSVRVSVTFRCLFLF